MAGTNELTLKIEGMHCAGCVATIEKGVVGLPGVAECKVNLALASAKVRFDTGRTGESSIIQKIKELGYRAVPGTPDILASNENEITAALRRFLISAVLSVPLMILAMWPMVAHRHILAPARDEWLQAVLACLALFVAGRSIMADALQQLRHLRANMNSLIALGTLAAFGWSLYALIVLGSAAVHNLLYFDSAGMIITLILLGRYLEARARGKAGQAIKALLNLRPAQATAVINDVEVPVDVGSVKPGMLLMVRPGERIAADGEILESRPFVDESMLTGESVPIEKKAGDRVLGGSMNGNVPFTFRVTAAGEQSFLSSIIRLVSEAQSRKAPVQNLADRVAGVFVPIVIGIALLTLVAWLLLDRSNPMLIKSVISVLIIACPCALGLATPTAVLVGTGRAAREGIIVRGGDVLEGLTKVDAVIFDKTGTLTFGDLAVVDVRTFGKISKNDLLGMVGSAESRSEHPLAGAIVRFMHAERIEPMTITDLVAKPGFGLEARWNGHCLLVGNQSLMKAEGVDIAAAVSVAQQEMNKGFTVVFAALNGTLAGLISVADRLRPDSKDVVTRLKNSMKNVTMLTGDNVRTAEGVARLVGLDNFEAEVRPEQKQQVVQSFRQAGFAVAVVGDGINDAPALASADVGVAVSGGTDVAKQTADVVLVRSELSALLRMFGVAHATMRVIRQNLFWAFFYNVIAIPVAAGVFYPLFGWTLSPTIAAAAMAFSSVFVVTNSLRLNRLELKP